MKFHLFLATASLALAACSNEAADQPAPPADENAAADADVNSDMAMPVGEAANAMPTDAAGYVAKAGAGDKWEIESSKALLAKSKSAALKSFAEMMVKQHTDSTSKVTAAAKTANIAVPAPALDPEQQKMLDDINAATPETVDQRYIEYQKTAHEKALALHEGYAANGDNDALKKAAGEIALVVKAHIEKLQTLKP